MKQTEEYLPSIPLSTFEVEVPEDAEADAKAREHVEDIMRELEASMAEERARESEAEQQALESLGHVEIQETESASPSKPMSKIALMIPDLEAEEEPVEEAFTESDDENQTVVHRADKAIEEKLVKQETGPLPVVVTDVAVDDEPLEVVVEPEEIVVPVEHTQRLKVDEDSISTAMELAPPVQDKPRGFFASIGAFFARLFHLDG